MIRSANIDETAVVASFYCQGNIKNNLANNEQRVVVCSTPNALSPRTLSPHGLSTDGLMKTPKNQAFMVVDVF